VLKLGSLSEVEGVLLRPSKSTVIKRFEDAFIYKMLDPKDKGSFEVDDTNCKAWKRSKNHHCLKSGADMPPGLVDDDYYYELPPGHFIYEPPPKRR
jgi:hypothetical protein